MSDSQIRQYLGVGNAWMRFESLKKESESDKNIKQNADNIEKNKK